MSDEMCSRCGARAAGRYCLHCGLDTRPDKPVLSTGDVRAAREREETWLAANPDGAGTKRCPECAEEIQVAARVCRFCGYRFDGVSARPPSSSIPPASVPAAAAPHPAAAHKSPATAAVMGLLISGLGHLYVGEYARAALVFGSVVAAAIGVAMAPVAGLFVLGIWIFSVRDAYVGAEHVNRERTIRPLAGPVWAVVGAGAAALMIGIAAGGGSSAGDVEGLIRPELESQLQSRVPDATVSVDSLSCVSESDTGGSCLADVSDSLGNTQKVSISYSVDPDTGDMIWHTQ